MSAFISVIMPSYNQGAFIERSIKSVLAQTRDLYQFIVMDGNSTDITKELLSKYKADIDVCVSEKDSGQSDALQKGLGMATGEFIGWQNSDDLYDAGAFDRFRKVYDEDVRAGRLYDVYYSHQDIIDSGDRLVAKNYFTRFSQNYFMYCGFNFSNQSMFIRRSKLIECGGFDAGFQYAMDCDLFYRLIRGGAKFRFVRDTWGAFRIHGESKGSTLQSVRDREWKKLRTRELPAAFQPEVPWERQFRVRRSLLILQRHVRLMLQGDWFKWAIGKVVLPGLHGARLPVTPQGDPAQPSARG